MSDSELQILERQTLFNGSQMFCRAVLPDCGAAVSFGLFLPPMALRAYAVPALYFVADDTGGIGAAVRESGIQRAAAQWNMAVVFVETAYPAAAGGGLESLAALLESRFPLLPARSLTGLGSGAAAAVAEAAARPHQYAAVSGFAPQWGGEAAEIWQSRFQTALTQMPLLLDVCGGGDEQAQEMHRFLRGAGKNVQCRLRSDYAAGYFLAASFAESHIGFHADALGL